MSAWIVSFIAVTMSAACSGGGGEAETALGSMEPASIAGEADAHLWASASAPNALFTAYAPISAADLSRELGEETCPAVTEEENRTIYEGGCTDSDGDAWVGRATVEGSMPSAAGFVDYDGFGFEAEEECDGQMVRTEMAWNGTIDASSGAGGDLAVDIDAVAEGTMLDEQDCVASEGTVAIAYSLTMQQDGEAEVWNGSGRIGNSTYGFVEARTEDELLDDAACDSEALSGTTTVLAGEDEMVITYDGAEDCDEESTVTWSLNGVEQGELTGVQCRAAGAGGAAWLAAALALGLIATRRRRRA